MRHTVLVRLLLTLAVFSLVAAACSGESTSTQDDEVVADNGGDSGEDDNGEGDNGEGDAEDAAPEETTPPEEADESAAAEPLFAEDPYGGAFADYQASYDRSQDPFSSLDALCLEHPAAEGRTASMDGITEDTIQIGHLRSQLENLAAIGFGVEVGNVAEMFDFLVAELNEKCGGIRGRTLLLETAESDPLAPDIVAELTSACLKLTEDVNSVMVMNSTGFQTSAVFCVTEEHATPLITTQGLPQEFYERSNGLLMTMDLPQVTAMRNLVLLAEAEGLLEGKTIGLVSPDTPGIADEFSVIGDVLAELGYEVAVSDQIGCGGGTQCGEGLQDSVARMKAAGVDALFPGLNILSLPGYVSEMVTQGFATGDVQFFNSSVNSQNGDLVSSKVRAFGGEAAAELYNGAFIVDAAYTGFHQTEGAFIPPFNQMCMDAYEAQGGKAYDYFASGENTEQGMLASICTQLRIMARVLYNAGDNPTPESIKDAIANLGTIDSNGMLPASIDGFKGADDAVQNLRWTWPCEFGEEGAFDKQNTCVVPTGNYVPVQR